MHEVPPALVERLLAARRRHIVPAKLRPLAREFGPLALGVLFPHFADALSLDEASVRQWKACFLA